MLSGDEQIKPFLSLLSTCVASSDRSTVRSLPWPEIQLLDDVSATPLAPAPFNMAHSISPTAVCPEEGQSGWCTRVHGAGFEPNTMSRFMHSNSHEVLFVN